MAFPHSARVGVFVLVVFVAGCPASIRPLFDEAKSSALADPGPAPATWQPDAIVELAPDTLEATTRALLDASGLLDKTLDAKVLGVPVDVDPDLNVKTLDFGVSRRCAQCLDVKLEIDGRLSFGAAGVHDVLPVHLKGAFDAILAATADQGTWTVTLAPRGLRDLDVDFGGKGADLGPALKQNLGDAIRSRLEGIPPVALGRFGDPKLPLRAARLLPLASGGVQIALSTRAPRSEAIAAEGSPNHGFRLTIAQSSLLALAQVVAYQQAPQTYDIVPAPTSLVIADDRFTLGLRLWRLTGPGWWRDYTVSGRAALVKRGLSMVPDPKGVTPIGASPGAALADPLAALGQGLILQTIEDAVNTVLPLPKSELVGRVTADLTVQHITGTRDLLVVDGTVDVARTPRQHPRPH